MALTPALSNWQLNKLQKSFDKQFFHDADGYIVERVRAQQIRRTAPATGNRSGHRQRQEGTRSSAASGDGNSSEPEPEPEPERRAQQSLRLYDQASLADLLQISKKTLQNLYSVAPHSLPSAIQIPGARGPRWTPASVQAWLENRPRHTAKPVVVAPKNKVGRPRIVDLATARSAGKAGAA